MTNEASQEIVIEAGRTEAQYWRDLWHILSPFAQGGTLGGWGRPLCFFAAIFAFLFCFKF